MNDRFYSMTISDIEQKLNTNAASGLDPKEAERRRRRGGAGSIYKSVSASPVQHIAKVGADITVILFILAAFISAFFDGGGRAVASMALSFAALAVSIVSYYMSRRIFENAAELSIPRAKVLRGGKVYTVDSRDVVYGDVILIEKGDVLPCDCRLVSSAGLRAVEFVGKIGGKEKKELTVKNASAVYRPEDKPGVAAQQNMISAAAVVSSGSGRAIAVRTGRKTFISLMLGEIDAFPASKKEINILLSASRLLSKCSLALLIAAVPITVIAMLIGKNDTSILDVLLAMLALAVTSGSEIIGGMLYIFPSVAIKRAEKDENGACIKTPGAIQELNYLDSVLLLGKDSICDDGRSIESVFASNRFYDAVSAEKSSDQALNCMLDLALLGTAHYLTAGIGIGGDNAEEPIKRARAISVLAVKYGIDREKLLNSYELTEFLPASSSGFDTSLVRSGEEYRVICISDNSELLGLCTHIRTPDGALPFDRDKKSDILRACSQLHKKAKGVTLVASRISPCSSLSRLGAVQNQLIFEGYIVYKAPYLTCCADRLREMREADISLYFAAPESADSVITAFNIGAVKGKHEIAYASAFKRMNKSITDDFGQYRAYLGFTVRELERLAKQIRGEDGTLAVVASETEQLALMNSANVSVALSDMNTGGPAESISHYSEIVGKNADILIPRAKNDSGGFEAFCRAVLYSKNACTGLARFFRYLAFSASLRFALSVIPLFFGQLILSSVQIVFLGFLIDIPAIFCFSRAQNITDLSDRIDDVETMMSSPIKNITKYLVCGAVLGAIMLMMAAVFGGSDIATGTYLSVFALVGAALSQIFALLIILRPRENDRRSRRFLAVQTTAVVLLLLLSLVFDVLGSLLGVSYPGWQVCAAAPLVSVIGYVMLLVTDRYI